jgi:hypothetical protein
MSDETVEVVDVPPKPKRGLIANLNRKGRLPGSKNKTGADVREAARGYSMDCLKQLHRLSQKADTDSAKIAAIREILDRAWGKPTQPVQHAGEDGGPVQTLFRVVFVGGTPGVLPAIGHDESNN